MELKKGPLSFFQLIIGGLKTANRAFGAALALLAFAFVINVGTIAIITVGTLLFRRFALIIQIPFGLCLALMGVIISLALIQILASKIEKTGLGAWDSLTSSVLPAIYFIVSSLLLIIPVLLVLVGAVATHSAIVVAVACILLFFLMLPFVFVRHAIVLREEDPISALRYSWVLVTSHYGRVLLYLLGIGLLAVFYSLVWVCALKALAGDANNSQMLQMQLMALPKLSVALGGLMGFVISFFVSLTFEAFFTILFLNLDYCHRQVKMREHDTPLVQAAVGVTDPVTLTKEVKVKHASVETTVNENTIGHLEKVYSAQEHLSKGIQQEEDRMPTLLFDEDMMKKLSETQQKQEEQDDSDDPDDPPSIKISNGSL